MIEKQVTEKEFFAHMRPLNVHPRVVGPWPYVSLWVLQNTYQIIGRSESGSRDSEDRYFLLGELPS